MFKTLAVLATATSTLAFAAPAFAQDTADRYADGAETLPVEEDAVTGWEAEAMAGAPYADGERPVLIRRTIERRVEGDTTPGHHPMMGADHAMPHPHHPRHEAPRFAYSAAERDEWLAQCRALRAGYDVPADGYYVEEGDDRDGGIIGGLLGAIGGGVIGNRVADGSRFAGTLIGAGIGGVAGALIGAAIDGGDDDDRRVVVTEDDYVIDYCEAYLVNYERGYGVPYGRPVQVAYAPAMMAAPAPQHRAMTHRVIEEDILIDDSVQAPPPPRIRREIAPRPEGKLQRID